MDEQKRKTDQEFADAIQKAADEFNAIVTSAYLSGLRIWINEGVYRMPEYIGLPHVAVSVVRPIVSRSDK